MSLGEWWGRRIVRAELEPTEQVVVLGVSPHRLEQYRDQGRGWKRFDLAVGLVQTALFAGLVLMGLTMPWWSPQRGSGPPLWSAWTLGLPLSVAFGFALAVWQAGLRAMWRERDAPRVEAGSDA